jgi:hypothetical protein
VQCMYQMPPSVYAVTYTFVMPEERCNCVAARGVGRVREKGESFHHSRSHADM